MSTGDDSLPSDMVTDILVPTDLKGKRIICDGNLATVLAKLKKFYAYCKRKHL